MKLPNEKEARIDFFLKVAKNIKNSKENIWLKDLKNDGYCGAYGELFTAYFLKEELKLEFSQLTWIEKNNNKETPDLEIVFNDNKTNCDNKVFCEIATIATADSIPDGFSSGNTIECKIHNALRNKRAQLQPNYPNIFIVVIPPDIILDKDCLKTLSEGEQEVTSLISEKTGNILSSKINRTFKIKHKHSQYFPVIFADEIFCDILAAIIVIQDTTIDKQSHRSTAYIIKNSKTKHPIPFALKQKLILFKNGKNDFCDR